jgi:hypothetical protein
VAKKGREVGWVGKAIRGLLFSRIPVRCSAKLFYAVEGNAKESLERGTLWNYSPFAIASPTIRAKRESLIRLLEQPDLGTLRIDVNQAIEEMDDLLEEFDRTFPVG